MSSLIGAEQNVRDTASAAAHDAAPGHGRGVDDDVCI
jgi:hypothetical protein